jgi:hypothetical protein
VEKKKDMNQNTSDEISIIAPEKTILDIVSKYRHTEAVFKQYDEKAGVCLCCQALFDSLEDLSEKYGLDFNKLTADLEAKVKESS